MTEAVHTEYLTLIREGRISPADALKQLQDEFADAIGAAERIIDVLDALGHEDASGQMQLARQALGEAADAYDELR